MTTIEKATCDYLESLSREYGRSDIELVLPDPIYRALARDLLSAEPREIYGWEYDHFTWSTLMGPVVVHRSTYPKVAPRE